MVITTKHDDLPTVVKQGNSESPIEDANEKLLALLDAAVDAIIIIDHRGNIELFNRAAEHLFGYKKDDVLDCNVKMLMPSPYQDEHDSYLHNYVESHQAKIIGTGRQVKAKKANGEIFPISLSVGEVDGASHPQFVGIIRDISEQEKTRIEAQENRERLSHVSRLNSMGEMAAGIAHEINQPLTAVTTYAQACRQLLKRNVGDVQERLDTTLIKISDQAIRASEVISRLREFVKKRTSKRQVVDLNKLITETVNLAAVDTRLLDHRIHLELASGKPTFVLADPIQIQQVLLNLIRNGLDAMEDLIGAKMTISSQFLASDMIEVSVADEGVGIDEQSAKDLFSPFFTTKDSGMGMGLSVSQTIIHAHGGNIVFCTGVKNGSVFRFSLPMTSALQEMK